MKNCRSAKAQVSLPKVVPNTIARLAAISRLQPETSPAAGTRVSVPAAEVGLVSEVGPRESVGGVEMKPGLYANIRAKRERIARGSGERMRKPGTKGAPTAEAFRESAKTAKKPKPKGRKK